MYDATIQRYMNTVKYSFFYKINKFEKYMQVVQLFNHEVN